VTAVRPWKLHCPICSWYLLMRDDLRQNVASYRALLDHADREHDLDRDLLLDRLLP
jgi:hypothetical protein